MTSTVAAPTRSWSAAGLRLSDDRLGAVLLVLALGVGAALRVWTAFNDDGVYWPDEIFQSLEPAHRLAFGSGLLPWEYVEGARSWAFPGLLAAVLKLCDLAGLDRPEQYLAAVRLIFCGLGVLTAFGVWRLARVLGAGAPAAAAGAAVFALAAPLIYLSPRALSETASAAPVVFAFAVALRDGAGRRAMIAAGSLLGLAVLLRLQSGVFCIGLLAVLAGARRWTNARDLLAVLIVWAALFGALDWLTWGRPFHSALEYLRFNLVDGRASEFGVASHTYYFDALLAGMPWLTLAVFGLMIPGWRTHKALMLVAFAAFLLLWLIPHKELRFAVPMLPLFCALAAIGLEAVGPRLSPLWGRQALATALCALGLVSAAGLNRLTFDDLGQVTDHRPPGTRALDEGGSRNRLMMVAGRRADLCGLYVAAPGLAWTGGHTATHHPAPIWTEDKGARVNYAVVPASPGARGPGLEGAAVALDGGMALIRLTRPSCGVSSGAPRP